MVTTFYLNATSGDTGTRTATWDSAAQTLTVHDGPGAGVFTNTPENTGYVPPSTQYTLTSNGIQGGSYGGFYITGDNAASGLNAALDSVFAGQESMTMNINDVYDYTYSGTVPAPSQPILPMQTPANTPEKSRAEYRAFPLAADTAVSQGHYGAVDASGNLTHAAASGALTVVGRLEESADNTGGAAGDARAVTKRGCFLSANSATAPVLPGDVGKDCFIEDSLTVAKTGAVKAGRVHQVTAEGVWVDTF